MNVIAAIILLACSMLSVATLAGAAEDATPRSFSRFDLDAATADGLWAEVATSFLKDAASGSSGKLLTVLARLVYGTDKWEAGLAVPYQHINLEIDEFYDFESWLDDEKFKHKADGIGDIDMYGKFMPLATEWLAAGIGLDMTLPSGDENEGLGIGTVGFLPYAAGAVQLGFADLRAHIGYSFFADSAKPAAIESLVYGTGLFCRLGPFVGLRGELIGESFFDSGTNFNSVSFEPGLDLRLPLPRLGLLFRLNGDVGINENAVNYGIGGSVVLTWKT